MLSTTQGDVTTAEGRIHYYRTGGRKPPFLLLHGATDNGLCWTPVAELLSDRYDVIMPDALGHGLSDRLGENPASRRDAAGIPQLARELGLENPIIMGHSMGAGTAVDVAVAHPDLPRALVLEDPAWFDAEAGPPGSGEDAARRQESFRLHLQGLRRQSLDEIMATCRKENPRWSEAEIRPWAESKLQVDPALFSRPMAPLTAYTELVPRIWCHTLLITAESGLVTAAVASKAAGLWRSGHIFKVVRINGAGHNIRREQFGDFRKALFDFVGSLPGR